METIIIDGIKFQINNYEAYVIGLVEGTRNNIIPSNITIDGNIIPVTKIKNISGFNENWYLLIPKGIEFVDVLGQCGCPVIKII